MWAETASQDELAGRARDLGLLRVDSETLRLLGDEIQLEFDLGNALIELLGESYLVSVELPSLTWQMRLQKLAPQQAAAFLASLNVSQFANHSYLAYKVSQLEKAMRAKDKYTLYLEENYKTVNGTALMDKYRRQNAGDAALLEPYSRNAFDTRIREQYGLLERKLEADPNLWGSLLWDLIGSVVRDIQTWRAGLWIQPTNTTDTSQVKSETTENLKSKVQHQRETNPIEVKSEKESVPKNESPNKRRRVGLIGRLRQASEDSPSPSAQSPVKRKRVGIIKR